MEAQVVVAGGGPVGLTLALDLAWRGVDVVVVEPRHRAEAPDPKCNHISSRSMEIFRRLGVADALRSAGLPDDHPHDVAFRTTFTGHELSRITIPGRRDRREGRVRGPDADWPTPEPPHRVNQTFLEPVLSRHAETVPGLRLLNRCQVDGFQQSDDGVTVDVADLDRSQRLSLRASFLVGCDGARSTVRRQLGIRLEGDEVISRTQSSVIRAPGLLARTAHRPAWGTLMLNPRRSGTVYAIDGTETFLLHNYLRPHETDFDAVDRDWAIRTILGVDEQFPYELVSHQDWFGRRLIAPRFAQDRVFLCGDAAHIWVPYGGYGMNAGIADAAGLAWLLAAHLHHWAPSRILDAYDSERRPITDQVSRHAMAHAEAQAANRGAVPANLEEPGPAADAARAAYGEALVQLNTPQYCCAGLNFGSYLEGSPLVVAEGEAPSYTMGTYTPSTIPGCRLPHVWLDDGSSLYDRLGAGYTLLRSGPVDDAADRALDPLLRAAEARRVPLTVLDLGHHALVSDGQPRYLMVRPDQHLAWRSDEPPHDPAALLDRLTGAAP